MTTIVQNGDPILRKIADEVPLAEIGSPQIKKILRDMRAALEREEDGVALAAPQIGVALRIFVVSPRVFEVDDEDGDDGSEGRAVPRTTSKIPTNQPLVYINPTIAKMSRKKKELEEGCLSIRWLYGKVARAERATVIAYGADGKRFTRGAGGILAQIFQHEIDHLDGVLFIDKAKNIQDIPPERTKNGRAAAKQKAAASKKVTNFI